jgi:thiamine biosynthesis lipoprotein
MACDWDFWLCPADAAHLDPAARAAFAEVDRIEGELSRFIQTSDVARINGARAGRAIRVGVETLECLELAAQVHADTGGRFDVTIGGLLPRREASAWEPPQAASARAVGMRLLSIDRARRTVTKLADRLVIDLGAVGKGYALDLAAGLLREWGVTAALLHCGQSTVLALGSPPAPPGAQGWTVGLRDAASQARVLGHVVLRDAALSGSGRVVHGDHIIDPLDTTRSADAAVNPSPPRIHASWALAPSAALSDALSTAFFLLSAEEIAAYCDAHPGVRGIVSTDDSHYVEYGAGPAFARPADLRSQPLPGGCGSDDAPG